MVLVIAVGCCTGGLGGGVTESERGGSFGVDDCVNGTFDEAAVEVVTTLAVLTVVVVLAAAFSVGLGRGVVVVVLLSLSFDLKKLEIPLKNPFFFVVASGASVVVVVVGGGIGGKGLKSDGEYDNEWI